ncbi:hypothetical protein [Microbacterium sp. 2MCAF23]|uniref:hypothetical protein n=1 Tax=Microbacterium sp. 2MCAF23 TaxID=3232985 RepID=UPI003F9979C7
MSTPQGAELSQADHYRTPEQGPNRDRTPWLRVAAVMVAWVAAQELTPSLSAFGGGIVQPQVLLVQGCIAAAIALLLTLSYPDDVRALFAYSRATWLYLLVPVAVVVYVVRVGSAADILEPLWWTAVAVVWRWFLFGILQRRLSEWFSSTTVILTSAALFGSWMIFGVVGPTVSEIFRFPLAVLVATLLGAVTAIIPSSIMLTQKNVHALVALNLVASTLVV